MSIEGNTRDSGQLRFLCTPLPIFREYVCTVCAAQPKRGAQAYICRDLYQAERMAAFAGRVEVGTHHSGPPAGGRSRLRCFLLSCQ